MAVEDDWDPIEPQTPIAHHSNLSEAEMERHAVDKLDHHSALAIKRATQLVERGFNTQGFITEHRIRIWFSQKGDPVTQETLHNKPRPIIPPKPLRLRTTSNSHGDCRGGYN